jgi:hypothetical protein
MHMVVSRFSHGQSDRGRPIIMPVTDMGIAIMAWAEIEDTPVTDRQDEVEYQLADLLTLAVHVLDRQCLLQPGGHLRVLRRVGGRELLPANGTLRAEQVKHRATLGREGVRLTRTHSER